MREKFFLPLTLAICALVFVAWYQFFYETTQREIAGMELETRRLREVEREISTLKARHGDLTAFAEAKALQLDDMRNFLPPTLSQDEFISGLYRAAESARAQIISVQAGNETADDKITTQVINVRLETGYIALLNFIRATLDGERLTVLESFSAESSGGNVISCALSFKIFAAPEVSSP